MLKDIISLKVRFEKEECHCGVEGFYELAAKKIGYYYPQKARFDCTKISVTDSIMHQIIDYYLNEKQMDADEVGALLVIFGPKADLKQEGYIAEIQNGFIVEEV